MLGIRAKNLKVKEGIRVLSIDLNFGTNVVLDGKSQRSSQRGNARKALNKIMARFYVLNDANLISRSILLREPEDVRTSDDPNSISAH